MVVRLFDDVRWLLTLPAAGAEISAQAVAVRLRLAMQALDLIRQAAASARADS
jgi:hypothetical protein